MLNLHSMNIIAKHDKFRFNEINQTYFFKLSGVSYSVSICTLHQSAQLTELLYRPSTSTALPGT